MINEKVRNALAIIRTMNIEELKETSKRFNSVWKDKHRDQAVSRSLGYCIGDTVEFDKRGGGIIEGIITKKNLKTATVKPEGNKFDAGWNVPWSILRKVAA